MLGLFFGVALFAALAGMLLLFAVLRRIKSEPYFTALAFALLLFEIFNATAFAALLAASTTQQTFFAQAFGYFFALMLPVGAWIAAPLVETPRHRLRLKLLLLAAGVALGWRHATHGLLHVLQIADNGFVFVLAPGGKIFFAAAIVAIVLLLGKLEPMLQALEWRAGKRSRGLRVTLFLLLLTLMASCSLCLIYGRLDYGLWLVCQIVFGAFCALLVFAFRRAPQAGIAKSLAGIRLSRLLSSSVLISAGVYCIAFGALVKAAMLLGGSRHLFVSFFAALGAIVLALVLLTGNSWQKRWSRFVDRHWRARSYDFRFELHRLIERLATAATRAELAQALGAGLREIFSSTHCTLWLREEQSRAFTAFSCNGRGQSEPQLAPLLLSSKQAAWLERVGENFLPEQFFFLEAEKAEQDLQSYGLMTPLQVGPKLIGLIGLGNKSEGRAYREEERRLLDVLANAASLALHEAYLQERVSANERTEAISRLAAFIAHDLRHAVSTLGLLAHNAKAHLDKPEFRADFLASLSRVSREMHTLVQRLSAIKTGAEATHFAECDAAQLIREVAADAQIAPPIVLDLRLEALPQVWWDEEQIRIVLRNLLVNAREAMPKGGALTVHAHCVEERVHLVVSDTGVGMSPEFIRDRLFRPNQTTKAKGLGLGLYQSREIVRAHRGEILVESELGKGARFEVVLPCRAIINVIQQESF
jgi:putative PEP-CTERM system histidine kinase